MSSDYFRITFYIILSFVIVKCIKFINIQYQKTGINQFLEEENESKSF